MSDDGLNRSLWEFSLALYAQPGVAVRCLALQDECGADVNLLLCAAWVGASGRGQLDAAAIADLEIIARPLHENVVQPLRAARIWLKAAAGSDPELAKLRTEIKRLELSAERAEQARLESQLRGDATMLDRQRRRAAAISNMAVYLARLGCPAAAADVALERGLDVLLASGQDGPA